MANELKFGNKVVFLGGNPITLPQRTSDPGSAVNGDMYYNTTDDTVKIYQAGAWTTLATGGAAANTSLSNLTTTSINQDLLPSANNTRSMGSSSLIWNTLWADSLVYPSGPSISLQVGRMVTSDGNTSVHWANRTLNSDSSTAQLDWSAGVAFPQLTASRVPYLDASKKLVVSAVTPTELGYLSGVTSAIQTQLDAKANDNIVIKKDGSVAYVANQPMGGFKLTGLAAGSGAGDSVRYEQAILVNGANAFTSNQSLGGNKFTNSADPVSGQDLVTLAYMNARLNGLTPKAPVRAATTANITLSGAQTIDGVSVVAGNRVLVKNQTAPEDNGIYVAASGAWSRSSDMDSLTPFDEFNGAWTAVQEGAQVGQVFVQYGTVTVVGTDPVTFAYYNPIAGLIGGDMITFAGSTFSVDLATASGLESTNPGNVSGQLRVKLEASNPSLRFTGSNELAVNLDAAGAITSGASGLIVGVDNSTLEISSNALRVKALGISNAHIAASAAIALTKLAAVTANRALASDGSGFIVASSVTDTELGYLSGVTSAIQTQLNGKASTALSNLASVAINTTLVSDTDNTDDLGTDSIEWKDVWAFNLKHNSSGTPNLGIMTTGNNGSIVMTAHGTGNLDVLATKMRRAENGAGSQYMEDQYFDSMTLASGTSSPAEVSSSLSFAVASFDGCVINYRIKEASTNKARIGQLIVSSDGTIASSSDQFSETASLGSALGLSLSADISGGNVRILYNNTHASNNATMRCHIRRFRA